MWQTKGFKAVWKGRQNADIHSAFSSIRMLGEQTYVAVMTLQFSRICKKMEKYLIKFTQS